MSFKELSSLQTKSFIKKYLDANFKDIQEGEENTLKSISLESLHELEHLKYSLNSGVRDKFFQLFSNSCADNTLVVEELVRNRRNHATGMYSAKSFYHLES